MIKIPSQDKKLVQYNRSNLLGNLWSTWNIDLQSNVGAIRVGSKFKLNTGTATQANLGFPVAFEYFDGRMFALCGDRIYKNDASDTITAFTEDASTGKVTTYNKDNADMVQFNDNLVATADTKIWKKASGSGAGAYTEVGSTELTSNANHKLCYFKKTNRLYVGAGNAIIKSMDTAWDVSASGESYYLDLGNSTGRIVTMVATSDRIFIAMVRQTASTMSAITKASVFEWDGVSAQVSVEHKIEAEGIMAMTLKNGVPYLIDSNGILQAYNGGGFQEVGRLPIDKDMLTNAASTFNERFIHPNGMVSTKNGTILCLVNNLISDNAGSIKENFPSGVWEWSQENGFVHKHPITLQGVAVTTITDNGQNRVLKVGALAHTNIYSTSASGRGTMMCGVNYYTSATVSTFGIFTDSPIPTDNATTTEGQKYGYFVTTWIHSEQVMDSWIKIFAKYRQLLNSTDKIILKYRFTEVAPTEGTITWINTSSFSTTTSLASYAVGDEVEIIQGTGSGKCSHITSLQQGDSVWIVVVDETYTGVTTGTAKARFQKWIKSSSVSSQTTEISSFPIGKSSVRIQIKCCMQFTGDNELFELALINKSHQLLA